MSSGFLPLALPTDSVLSLAYSDGALVALPSTGSIDAHWIVYFDEDGDFAWAHGTLFPSADGKPVHDLGLRPPPGSPGSIALEFQVADAVEVQTASGAPLPSILPDGSASPTTIVKTLPNHCGMVLVETSGRYDARFVFGRPQVVKLVVRFPDAEDHCTPPTCVKFGGH